MAFALDYHGAHAPFASVDAMVARRQDLLSDADQVRALTGAALDVLSSHHAVDASRSPRSATASEARSCSSSPAPART